MVLIETKVGFGPGTLLLSIEVYEICCFVNVLIASGEDCNISRKDIQVFCSVVAATCISGGASLHVTQPAAYYK